MRKPEVEALEDIQPWFNIEGNDSSPKFLEEGRDSGPGPGGEILESLNLDPNGTVVGVKIKSPGMHFYKPEVKVRPILKSVTNGVRQFWKQIFILDLSKLKMFNEFMFVMAVRATPILRK